MESSIRMAWRKKKTTSFWKILWAISGGGCDKQDTDLILILLI